MLKTRVALRNVSCVLSNLIKRLIFAIQRLLLPSNIHAVKIHIFSLVHQLRLLHTLTFVFLSYLFRYCHMYFQLLLWQFSKSVWVPLHHRQAQHVFFFFWGGGGILNFERC